MSPASVKSGFTHSSSPSRSAALSLVLSLTLAAPGISHAELTPPVRPPLKPKKWSGSLHVPDPVASTVDPQGNVYVTQTTRRKVADLDIREHTDWIPNDVALDSVEAKRAFYHDVLAPGKTLKPRGELADHNKDGSIDWKDLTVHTERLYRLTDKDGDGVADDITVFAEGFNTEVTGIAAGILYFDGWVYTTIAPDLWRLRDNDGDGVADEREVVAHGFGLHIAYAGHDMHGLCVGPDGRIYWSIGDKGTNVTTKEGTKAYAPHEGAVLRCDPDGSNFQIFARGLRNPQEIAFDEFGNLFSVDNDADKPGEKERLVYITRNSDSGWRCYYQYMKPGFNPWTHEGLWKTWHKDQPAYITPPLALSHDGPAGFVYNPGTALGKGWERTFFLNLFPSGKMRALTVKPDGATFKLNSDEEVTAGVMGIGMSWSPTGELVFADWDGGYPLDDKGAVWKTDVAEANRHPERANTAALLRAGFKDKSEADLLPMLEHADQRVRLGAQFSLVKQGRFTTLQKIALDESKPLLARIHAIWGLGQGLRAGTVKLADENTSPLLSLLKLPAENADATAAELCAQLAKVAGEAKELPTKYWVELTQLVNHSHPRVRYHAGIALGERQTANAEATLALLKAATALKPDDSVLRHGVVIGLAGCATADELLACASRTEQPVRLAAVLALRRQAHEGIAVFLKDTDDAVSAEAARAIYDDESIPAALPALAAVVDAERAYPETVLRRALNAAFRLGGEAQAQRLVKFSLRSDRDEALRSEALYLASQWSTPPPLDHLDGAARKLPAQAHEKAMMTKAALPYVEPLMTISSRPLKSQAVSLATQYQLPVAVGMVATTVLDKEAPEDVRVSAVELLASQHSGSPELHQMLEQLLKPENQAPVSLRIAALEAQLKENPEAAVHAAIALLDSKTARMTERQKAIAILTRSASAKADDRLLLYARALAGEAPDVTLDKTLHLEVEEAMEARAPQSAAIAAVLDKWKTSQVPLTGTTAAYDSTLTGGNAQIGKQIALTHLAANCTACHRFDKNPGSEVGPPLNQIAKTRDAAHLLSALVTPAAEVTLGYGGVSATLKSGETVVGVLMKEDANSWTVRLPDNSTRTIALADITTRTPPISVMPPMNFMLNKREIRDLMAYLVSLKGDAKSKPKAAEH